MTNKPSISKEAYEDEMTTVFNNRRQRHRVEVIAIGPDRTILATPMEIKGYIELPGGGVNKGESYEAAAVRENEEEAGWLVENPVIIHVPGNWTHSAPDGSWLKENGYDEEVNIVVGCNAIEFKPKENFMAEGDGRVHKLLPIGQVISETLIGMSQSTDPRIINLGKLRIEAIRKVCNLVGIATESAPLYTKW
jgi:8-oxo-dGTP pyrophosphatase MutT (NUDIX family)